MLWHLAEVQWFWGTIVRQALQRPPLAEVRPARPASRSELLSFYSAVSAELVSALGSAAPQDRVWTWSDDHNVAFVRRRQAHEALIHRIDAELTIGLRTSMDAQLSDDGIDEALCVMYGRVPDWATFSTNDAGVIRLHARDNASTWLVRLGRLTGIDPDDGTAVDEACLDVADDSVVNADATLTGSAADLDCWLWRRPTIETLRRAGDNRLLDQLEMVIGLGID
ncbi:maleylpyruvate isomerase N-terminal domain-containing protein [Ferrimicrobium acidiphilum]|uniref:maleylpyruvate isomerase N-terminal domain-containing protein n=1 Tax=Ferrimicrobium acidiphilum TaxID=121039 RepID=UPI0023F14C2D|nr:maleylpyruvate isomerase N-terminal domain-containing protein [Ferrimicrobium acidiphilum]